MAKNKFTTDSFKEAMDLLHNKYYDYSLVDFKGVDSNVIIICPVHGKFNQTPYKHSLGRGCRTCGINKRTKASKKTTEWFIEKAKIIHRDHYDYSKSYYINNHTKVIINCSLHGEFSQTPMDHLKGRGCVKCGYIKSSKSLTNTFEYFFKKADKIHSGIYKYPDKEYDGLNKIINIECSKHGLFKQNPKEHLRGKGCRKCSDDFNTYKRQDWITKGENKNKEGIFYVLKMTLGGEVFCKIGITYHSVKKRYSGKECKYNIEILEEIKSYNLSYIWDLEKQKKIEYSKFSYKPLIKFGGSFSECFTLDILKIK